MLISSTKRDTKGAVTVSGQQQQNSRLYMDDVNTTTNTVTQTHHLLQEISRFFSWGRLAVNPEKCRCLVLDKGMLKEIPVYWEKEVITSITEKPIRYLGKEYNYTLSEKKQMEQTLVMLTGGLKKIEKTFIAGKYKAWILQKMLIQKLMWPLMIYGFPQPKILVKK